MMCNKIIIKHHNISKTDVLIKLCGKNYDKLKISTKIRIVKCIIVYKNNSNW